MPGRIQSFADQGFQGIEIRPGANRKYEIGSAEWNAAVMLAVVVGERSGLFVEVHDDPEELLEDPTYANACEHLWAGGLDAVKRLQELSLATGSARLAPHMVADSISGFRKWDPLAAGSDQQPWWPHQRLCCDRVTRLAAALAQGEPSTDGPQFLPEDSSPEGNADGDTQRPELLWQHRVTDVGSLFFLLNPSETDGIRGIVRLPAPGTAFAGDPGTGAWSPIASLHAPSADGSDEGGAEGESETNGVRVGLNLSPAASALILVSQTQPPELCEESQARDGGLQASLELPAEFIAYAEGAAFLPIRDWSLSMCPDPCGANLYKTSFQIADLPSRLGLIVDEMDIDNLERMERAGTLTIRLNDALLSEFESSPHVDRRMRYVDITSLACPGENVIQVECTGEDAYFHQPPMLAGDFCLQRYTTSAPRDGTDWVLTAPPNRLPIGSWTDLGYPFFAGTMVYRCRVDVPETFRKRRVEMLFEGLAGSARVSVDGAPVGAIGWRPWVLHVPALREPGPHDVRIEVTNTLANLFHGTQFPAGITGPVRLLAR